MATPYSTANADYSSRAHLCARRVIYPRLFGGCVLGYETQGSVRTNARWEVLDGTLGIDRVILVTAPKARRPFTFTSQERFRQPSFQRFDDVTITARNMATNQPSELHKLAAMLFVYGFYDAAQDVLTSWVALNTVTLMLALTNRSLPYTTSINPRSQQAFISISRSNLRSVGAVIAEG